MRSKQGSKVGEGVGCRELLSLLKWQALPARKGQLGTNRNGVEKKAGGVAQVPTICACPRSRGAGPQPSWLRPRWSHHLRNPQLFLTHLSAVNPTPPRRNAQMLGEKLKVPCEQPSFFEQDLSPLLHPPALPLR